MFNLSPARNYALCRIAFGYLFILLWLWLPVFGHGYLSFLAFGAWLITLSPIMAVKKEEKKRISKKVASFLIYGGCFALLLWFLYNSKLNQHNIIYLFLVSVIFLGAIFHRWSEIEESKEEVLYQVFQGKVFFSKFNKNVSNHKVEQRAVK